MILDSILEVFHSTAPYLLFGLVLAGLVKAFLPSKLVDKFLGEKSAWGILKASLIGAPLPLCSCSVIPVLKSVLEKGANRASGISFLVSTPETGVDSIALTYGTMGPHLALIRPVLAVVSACISGLVELVFGPHMESPDLSELNLDSCCKPAPGEPESAESCSDSSRPEENCSKPSPIEEGTRDLRNSELQSTSCCPSTLVKKTIPLKNETVQRVDSCSDSRLDKACGELSEEPASESKEPENGCCSPKTPANSDSILSRVWAGMVYSFDDLFHDIYKGLFLGMILAALIAVLVPTDLLKTHFSGGLTGYLLMLVASVPLYICATSSTPLAVALMVKGVSPGTALVLLMAGPATNLTSLVVIRSIYGTYSTALYLLSLVVSTILFAYAIDYAYQAGLINLVLNLRTIEEHSHISTPGQLSSLFLLLLFLVHFGKAVKKKT